MKTHNYNEIAKQLLKKDGTLSQKALKALGEMNVMLETGKWHYNSWSGHGNYINLVERKEVAEVAEMFGIRLKVGNDAPRGGKVGEYYYVEGVEESKMIRATVAIEKLK